MFARWHYLVLFVWLSCQNVLAADFCLKTEPYLSSNLYTRPVVPSENDKVILGVEIPAGAETIASIAAQLQVRNAKGNVLFEKRIELARDGDVLRAEVEWNAGVNGMYNVEASLDPDNAVAESDETNNSGQLLLPVLVKGRSLFFPWYTASQWVRWANVAASVDQSGAVGLARRGIKPLAWAYGGMSWSYFDDKRLNTERDVAMKELEDQFAQTYASEQKPPLAGFGIDETGGYPDTAAHWKSIATTRGLIRARKTCPERFFAVWHGGGLTQSLAELYRQSADLVLLETYVWRAIPDEIGGEDIYQVIRDRLDPIVRSLDMLMPTYGSPCHTLIALDTSERPDRIDLGEQEQVVRFIRRICPEMRGLAHYNSGYGGYGLEKTPETDAKHQAVIRNADRLCFDYYVKPCITLAPESLWLTTDGERTELVAAISNIGGMDAGPVTIAFFDGQERLGDVKIENVPAGPNRNKNRAFARIAISPKHGMHAFAARIEQAPDATLLDGEITLSRFVPEARGQ